MPLTKSILSTFLVCFSFYCFSQTEDIYIALLAPQDLRSDANAIVRYESQKVEVKSYNKMYVTNRRIVTVYNKYGNKHGNAYEFYDSNTKIRELEVHIYDALGKEIKKIKSKDFIDESAVSGGTLYSDNRIKYLSYTPVKYPYTIEYYSEVELRSTAFIPQWRPINGYYLAIQHSEYNLINDSGVKIRFKQQNYEDYNIENLGPTHFITKGLKGIKPEAHSPDLLFIVPCLKAALTQFDMEGVEGVNNNWKDFGKWMYDKLLTGTDKLPQSAIDDIKLLTQDVDDKIERAQLVYRYMQDKTRYTSVQVGIGGWKPMLADEVDRLGYADCKGLTNYTKALLEAANVPSYYTVVWGDGTIKNIDKEFSVTEGNHVILCVPNNTENIFLECTSQTNPFGFTAGFTDDRDVLLVKPEGGEIVHTKVYEADDSIQKNNGNH
jgi:transglutaminase-like putative cysteine protease